MKLSTYLVADVSTGYLPDSDLSLIDNEDAPNHLANLDDGAGSFFYTPLFGDDEATNEDWTAYEEECKEVGLSEKFIAIMKAAFDQKIRYVRFDRDGEDIPEMEKMLHD